MATIGELPYDLLCYIILLLVQLPGGATDFARIVSVCRKFRLLTQDKDILELVNFDAKLELKNIKWYQHINSLLVKCSEAGNVAAQFFLGKVILVSSSQLLLGEWQKSEREFHPYDFATLSELSCINISTNVPTQNHEVGSFMAYFLPKQASTSEFSQTRLVHYQLVKLFLLNGSLNDFAEMSEFLKSYIKFFTSDGPLLQCVKVLVSHADRFRCFENRYMKVIHCTEGLEGSERVLNARSKNVDDMKRNFAKSRAYTLHFFELNFG